MKWEDNIINEVGFLENKDNYVSINTSINETALRVKFRNGQLQNFYSNGES